jgi:hypothetical protein
MIWTGETKLTRTVLNLSSAIETVTGLGLIVAPGLVAHLLLNTELSDSGTAMGRVAGLALLSLGLACWSAAGAVTPRAIYALFTYNLLATCYLAYLRVGVGFAGRLLWPAIAVHCLLTLLMLPPAYSGIAKKEQ